MAAKQSPLPECPVCWSPYDNGFRTPKVLQCRHSFCVECLAHLSLVSPAQDRLQCPLCRHPTALPGGQAVTQLPTDEAVLRLLRLEPNQVTLEGRQLRLKEPRTGRRFLRQPRVFTLDLGPEPDVVTSLRQDTPTAASTALPGRSALRECARNPQLRIFTYLMAVILSVTLVLVFSVFWTRQFFGGWG